MGEKIACVLEEFRQGKMVILVDDRRNGGEGHLIMAAEKVTPEAINFLARYARGIVCLAMTGDRLDDLDLPLMVQNNGSNSGKAFTVSIEAKHNVTTGISAFDRATTILTALDPSTRPEDIVRPGHIFPLRAVKHGVLSQASEIEAAVDLARLAGLYPAGVVCTLLNEDGMTPKLTEIFEFAKLHRLKIASIGDLIRYRIKTERLVQQISKIKLPLKWGEFEAVLYYNEVNSSYHIAVILGHLSSANPVLVRVHSNCIAGDIFGSLRCSCRNKLESALEQIADEGNGILIYLNMERGSLLEKRFLAYEAEDREKSSDPAHDLGTEDILEEYGDTAQILVDLGLSRLRVMTDNQSLIPFLREFGFKSVEVTHLKFFSDDLYFSNLTDYQGEIANDLTSWKL